MQTTVGMRILATAWVLLSSGIATADEPAGYLVCVSNERSGDVTIIRDDRTVATIPVGKRPRGIHAGPDGGSLYVALSGSPITGPPPLDAKGNPILKNDDDDEEADRTADGIGVVDLRTSRFVRKIPAGSDPEEFAVSKDG
jgi:DNA-binding beta-propeller fold protein YncE